MKMKISKLVANDDNPRAIKDSKFKKLVKSIQDFPEMLDLRPIVVNEKMVILGGNMRYRACIEAGLKEIPVTIAKGLTPEQEKEFIIKDNVGFGEWDWSDLANKWDNVTLGEWGMDVWQPEEVVDYAILDDLNLDEDVEEKTRAVKRAIQIEFSSEDYDNAMDLCGIYRKSDVYIGGVVLKALLENKPSVD